MYESKIKAIRTDNDTEFKNYTMQEFVDDEGIKHEFSAPYTPQQNGVVERKNRTIIEMTRTMHRVAHHCDPPPHSLPSPSHHRAALLPTTAPPRMTLLPTTNPPTTVRCSASRRLIRHVFPSRRPPRQLVPVASSRHGPLLVTNLYTFAYGLRAQAAEGNQKN
ncbi:hypothetical protein QYE76_031644 [Lolium multiflorum]|uniref:Integrase catalytic domain-containing protein n=1 Tax=Lolium multiflorum TaxID=4521 RepID=A0AAD8VJX2_LOLMU|nr:hypothetical protein QYE76_031644 [Lolium multiflorum]